MSTGHAMVYGQAVVQQSKPNELRRAMCTHVLQAVIAEYA